MPSSLSSLSAARAGNSSDGPLSICILLVLFFAKRHSVSQNP
jgi:hypothetical protein